MYLTELPVKLNDQMEYLPEHGQSFEKVYSGAVSCNNPHKIKFSEEQLETILHYKALQLARIKEKLEALGKPLAYEIKILPYTTYSLNYEQLFIEVLLIVRQVNYTPPTLEEIKKIEEKLLEEALAEEAEVNGGDK